MSHTFKHDPTGVRIFYNSDFSGDATIVRPDGSEFQVPAAALAEFGSDAEAEVALLRPVVEAAEALVKTWTNSGWLIGVDHLRIEAVEGSLQELIVQQVDVLAVKVKEAQR